MPVWLPDLETQLYRFMARVAARQFGKFAPVLSVYTRRNVACGEVVFGKSDIDIHILITPFSELAQEAQFLRDLTTQYVRLKRLLPWVGDCDVSTMAELEHYYRAQPCTWYRDRGWLKLYGKDWNRPRVTLITDEERASLLRWFFWAWERLPGFFRAGNVRTCCNLFLDMVNAYGLYVGVFDAPQRRAEVLRYWRTLCPPSPESEAVARGFSAGFRGRYRPLLRWIYGQSIKLCNTLALHVTRTVEGEGCGAELRAQASFSFTPRTYLLVDPGSEEQVTQALAAMQRRTEIVVTTEKTLKLSFCYRNPWEYYAVKAHNQHFPLAPPPAESFRQAVRFSLHKEIPRRAAFSIGRRVDRSATVGLQYAQCQLYVEHGKVATSAAELRQQYQQHYGAWPYASVASRDSYFLQDYPIACKTIEDLSQRVACG